MVELVAGVRGAGPVRLRHRPARPGRQRRGLGRRRFPRVPPRPERTVRAPGPPARLPPGHLFLDRRDPAGARQSHAGDAVDRRRGRGNDLRRADPGRERLLPPSPAAVPPPARRRRAGSSRSRSTSRTSQGRTPTCSASGGPLVSRTTPRSSRSRAQPARWCGGPRRTPARRPSPSTTTTCTSRRARSSLGMPRPCSPSTSTGAVGRAAGRSGPGR